MTDVYTIRSRPAGKPFTIKYRINQYQVYMVRGHRTVMIVYMILNGKGHLICTCGF